MQWIYYCYNKLIIKKGKIRQRIMKKNQLEMLII